MVSKEVLLYLLFEGVGVSVKELLEHQIDELVRIIQRVKDTPDCVWPLSIREDEGPRIVRYLEDRGCRAFLAGTRYTHCTATTWWELVVFKDWRR